MGNVLIIDDHLTTCTMLQQMIERIHHHAEYCHNLREGMLKVQTGIFDAVFLDVNMPDGNGLETLKQIQATANPPEVIIITGAGSRDGAEIAIRNGAWDYLQKPLSPKEIILPVKRVLEYRENLSQSRKTLSPLRRDEIIGSSQGLNHCLEQLARAAGNDSNVLLTGETGTGKEVFARTLHDNSNRASHQLIIVDCTALPENLMASTLFGHEKGAFTGADRATTGLVKLADRGSLFLDEIGDLDPAMQKTLLRVLQEKRFRPVGSTREIDSDFRLIAATNRNLEQMVKDGMFREDLYFRIRAQTIELPPLRERLEDIELLMVRYTRKICDKYERTAKGFSPDFLETLLAFNWPGNIRELLHTLEGAIHAAGDEPILFPKHLPENIRIRAIRQALHQEAQGKASAPRASTPLRPNSSLPPFRTFRESALAEVERSYLLQLMQQTGGNIKDACAIAEIGRTHLYNLLKKHGVFRTDPN